VPDRYADRQATVNQIFLPIERVCLESVFERGERIDYALLEPPGHTSPLRIRFDDLRRELSDRFAPELSNEIVAERIAQMRDEQILVTVQLDPTAGKRWSLSIRARFPYENIKGSAALLADQRRSPRRVPGQRHDVKVELGHRSIEGIVYNISEHGLGIAVLTAQDDAAARLHVEAAVAIIGDHGRAQGRIASQYPAAGGCVLGIELQERLVLPGLPAVEA
jgi:hypothetical protein